LGYVPGKEAKMGIFSRLFGSTTKYNDSQIVSQATTAITNDPIIGDFGSVVVTSKNGVVTVTGNVQKRQEKDRIEGVIRNALTTMGLKHERIDNELRLPQDVK
jgi:osmotically-inducible protein OsmY